MAQLISQNYVIIVILCAMFLLGAVTGVFGVFTVLRKQALVGDALSHAALPGVVLAYMVTHNKSMPVLLLGAALSSVAAIAVLSIIKKYSKVKNDAGLALILSAFFGFGQLLLKIVQSGASSSAAAGLSSFIFGQTATMLLSDVYFIAAVSVSVLLIIFLFWKEIKLRTFDGEFFESLGFSKKVIEFLMTFMTVTIVVIAIRAVGVILMSAMLISPAVAARQWSNKLSANIFLSAVFGVVSGVLGALISSSVTNLPTGPVVIIFLSIFLIISIVFNPRNGMLKKSMQSYAHKKIVRQNSAVTALYKGRQNLPGKHSALLIKNNLATLQDGRLILSEQGLKRAMSLTEEERHGI